MNTDERETFDILCTFYEENVKYKPFHCKPYRQLELVESDEIEERGVMDYNMYYNNGYENLMHVGLFHLVREKSILPTYF